MKNTLSVHSSNILGAPVASQPLPLERKEIMAIVNGLNKACESGDLPEKVFQELTEYLLTYYLECSIEKQLSSFTEGMNKKVLRYLYPEEVTT